MKRTGSDDGGGGENWRCRAGVYKLAARGIVCLGDWAEEAGGGQEPLRSARSMWRATVSERYFPEIFGGRLAASQRQSSFNLPSKGSSL